MAYRGYLPYSKKISHVATTSYNKLQHVLLGFSDVVGSIFKMHLVLKSLSPLAPVGVVKSLSPLAPVGVVKSFLGQFAPLLGPQ